MTEPVVEAPGSLNASGNLLIGLFRALMGFAGLSVPWRMLMLFLLAGALPPLRYLPSCGPFRFSWWPVSFLLAASATSALRFVMSRLRWLAGAFALAPQVLPNATIVSLLARTLSGLFRGELRLLNG